MLLNRRFTYCKCNRIWLSQPPGNTDRITYGDGAKQQHFDVDELMQWAISHLLEFIDDVYDARVLGIIIQSLGCFAEKSIISKSTFEESVAAITRGRIIELLSVDFIAQPSNMKIGLSLFELAVASRAIRGNGLWLPTVLEKIRKIALDLLSASRLVIGAGEKGILMECLLSTLSALMKSVLWQDALQFSCYLVSHSLTLIKSDDCKWTGLKLSTIDCLGCIWKESQVNKQVASAAEAAERRAICDQPWETDAINLCLAIISCEGECQIEERIRAARALHFVFLNKSRIRSQCLFRESVVGFKHDALFSVVTDKSLPSTLRISATKALDVWYSIETEFGDELLIEATDNDDDDDAELARNKMVFDSLAGTDASVYLHSKLSQRTKVGEVIGLKHDLVGVMLAWLLILQKIDSSSRRNYRTRFQCGSYLRKTGMLGTVVRSLVHAFPDLTKVAEISHAFHRIESVDEIEGKISGYSLVTMFTMFRTVCVLPAMFRSWWSDECTREQKSIIKTFIENTVSTPLAAREVALIGVAAKEEKWRKDEMTVRGSAMTGEVVAIYSKDEAKVELKILLPNSYPLRNVEVECSSKVGVGEGRWKRWVLQIIQILSMQDGSVVDALLYLKGNIDKEFEGVEPCPICYCILHPKSTALPSLSCPTCSNKFHSQCLYTWFKSSGKSKCVICQQPFFL